MGYWGKNMLFCSLSLLLRQVIFPHVTPNSSEYWFFSVLPWHLRWLKRFNVRPWRKKEGSETMVPYGVCSLQSIHNPQKMTRQMHIKPFSFHVIMLFASNVLLNSQRAHHKGHLPPNNCKWLVHQRLESVFPKKCSRSSLYWYFSALQTSWIHSCNIPKYI